MKNLTFSEIIELCISLNDKKIIIEYFKGFSLIVKTKKSWGVKSKKCWKIVKVKNLPYSLFCRDHQLKRIPYF